MSERRKDDARQAAIWAIEILNRHDAAAEADAGFDAGEYSGPGHHDAAEAELDRLAERHGISREELDAALNELSDGEPDLEEAYRCPDCGTGDPFDHSMACNAPVPDPATLPDADLPPASPCTSCGDLALDGLKGPEGLCEECEDQAHRGATSYFAAGLADSDEEV